MTAIQAPADLLRRLPSSARTTIYTAFVFIGAALGVCQTMGVETIGPVTVTRALEIYAYLAPLSGVVAVANVTKPAGTDEEIEPEGPVDLSMFEPVGDPEDVFAV
jgi:hypothetical protein